MCDCIRWFKCKLKPPKKLIDFSSNMFAHCMIGSKTWYKTCAWLVFGQLLSDYSIKSLDILTVIRHN